MRFFNPTRELKEMLLLQHIEENANTTHKEMAVVIDGAPSMVNVYMDRMEEEGYLIRDYQSSKVVYYNITTEGIKRKNFLSITYINELLELYRIAENNVVDFLIRLENKGYRNILVYGAGEVAETILGIIRGREDKLLQVEALIDDEEERQGKNLLGYDIISRNEIDKYKHDGIIIASYAYEDEIKEKLEEIGYPMDKVELFFKGM
ncbi:MAG: winged helix-turn-helix domain-containing protein [Tissierellaceae bacterium]